MRTSGCHGYVVKASTLTDILPIEVQHQYKDLLEEGDWEKLQNFLKENISEKYPVPESVFLFDGDMESDDLEEGEMYAFFNEADLFIKKESPLMEALLKKQIIPENSTWTVWG